MSGGVRISAKIEGAKRRPSAATTSEKSMVATNEVSIAA
jgi:hypothetical protein